MLLEQRLENVERGRGVLAAAVEGPSNFVRSGESEMGGGKIAPGRTAPPGTPLAGVLRAADEVASELNVSRAQVCIAWVLTHPEVTSSLAGAERPEHVDDNVAGSRLTLPGELLARLNAASDEYVNQTAGKKAG